ncbi:MAG: tail fiber protein [Terriglobales bacterium]
MQVYVGQIILAGFNFAPQGWAFCDGSLLSISSYDLLYSLIGTTYGGDGTSTFGLPDLRGHTPIGMGQLQGGGNYILGQSGGVENVAILGQTYPSHNHQVDGIASGANTSNPSSTTLAGGRSIYANTAATVALNGAMVSMSPGISAAHPNLQPYQTLNWIISLFGIYPSPS